MALRIAENKHLQAQRSSIIDQASRFSPGLSVLFHISMFPSSSKPSGWRYDVCDVVNTEDHLPVQPAPFFVLSLYMCASVIEKADVYSVPHSALARIVYVYSTILFGNSFHAKSSEAWTSISTTPSSIGGSRPPSRGLSSREDEKETEEPGAGIATSTEMRNREV